MLEADVLQRRIKAARLLRHLSQHDLDRLLHADGLGKGEASRTERGELTLTRVRRESLARHLRVPERWLMSDDVDEIVGVYDSPGPVSDETLRQALELLGPQLRAAVLAVRRAREQERRDKDDRDQSEESAEGDGK